MFASKGRECLADKLAGVVGLDLVGRAVPEQDLVSDCVSNSIRGAGVEAGELGFRALRGAENCCRELCL